MSRTRQTIASWILGAIVTTVIPSVVAAQGCALCYQSAAASGSRSIRALRNGILILMVPPVFICVGISYMVYRRRNLHNESS